MLSFWVQESFVTRYCNDQIAMRVSLDSIANMGQTP